MKKKFAYIFLFPLACFAYVVSATGQPFVTRIYTANDGLPDSYTQGIFQDRSGYLWIGTYTGLSRFDGQHFVTTEIKNKSGVFSANVLLQDHLQRLWVWYNKTVCILDKDSVIAFPTSDGEPMTYVFGAIELSNKKIWTLTSSGGYELVDNNWEKIQFPDELKNMNCRQVIEVPEGLYINFGRIIILKKNDGTYEKITPLRNDNLFYITIQKLGNRIYANTATGMIKIENGVISEIFKTQLSQTINYNFLIDSKKRFWISTEKFGILVSKPGEEKTLEHRVTVPFNLSTSLFEDRDNNIWAINYEGLIKIKDVAFTRFDKANNKIYDNIRYMAADSSGNIYIASTGNGLYKIESGKSQPVMLNFSSISEFIPDVIDGISFDNKNNLWVITRSKRLIRYDGEKAIDFTRLLDKTTQGFFAISFDEKSGEFLVASDKLYTGNEKGFRSWGENYKTIEILQPRFICKRKDGTFLINTRDSGIYLIDHNNNIINVSAQPGFTTSTRDTKIFDDPSGGFWVMKPGEGLTKFTEENNHFKKSATITTKDGLPNNSGFSAVFDQHNNLWLTTLSGPAIITNTAKNSPPKYSVNSGIL